MCNLLRNADKVLPATFKFDVILMAPACRTECFADTLAHHGSRIRDFRCFTMSDDFETKDRLVPAIYPHSLLYFISGVLEDEARHEVSHCSESKKKSVKRTVSMRILHHR